MTKTKEESILAKIRQDMQKLNPQNLGGSPKRKRIIRYELLTKKVNHVVK